MNKLPYDSRLPNDSNPLTRRLYEIFRNIASAHNNSYYWETNGTAAPTAGTWAVGDKCRNDSPSELGTAGSKYIITGWVVVTSGTPGTWKEMRVLTGS